ncbi:MAG TPA: hypothetical protein DGK91_00520 [Clostridium sp.]|nr:hypothetical protein [Clostridium sp.]
MSNIEYQFGGQTIALLCDYKEILQKKIDIVCTKIGFNDSKIKWYIFNPKIRKTTIQNILVGMNGCDYGYCITDKNEIWISALSIQKCGSLTAYDKINSMIKLQKKADDFLANVIIDEITHIQTGSNHGQKDYDNKFIDNMRKYYLSPMERMMLKESNRI